MLTNISGFQSRCGSVGGRHGGERGRRGAQHGARVARSREEGGVAGWIQAYKAEMVSVGSYAGLGPLGGPVTTS